MKKIKVLLLLVMGMIILGGCSHSNSGNQYIGKWATLEASKMDNAMTILRQLEITQNEESFIIKDISVVAPNEKPEIQIKSASLTKDGKLQVNQMDVYTFVESDNTLLWSAGIAYKKETPETLEKLKTEQVTAATERAKKQNVPVFGPK